MALELTALAERQGKLVRRRTLTILLFCPLHIANAPLKGNLFHKMALTPYISPVSGANRNLCAKVARLQSFMHLAQPPLLLLLCRVLKREQAIFDVP